MSYIACHIMCGRPWGLGGASLPPWPLASNEARHSHGGLFVFQHKSPGSLWCLVDYNGSSTWPQRLEEYGTHHEMVEVTTQNGELLYGGKRIH